jgi:uncharacterized protein (DUF1778 family)
MATQNRPLMVRLRPDTRQLLERAVADQGRSRSSLVEQAIRELLEARYADIASRLDQMLGGVR